MVDIFSADIEPLTFAQCLADALVAIAEQFFAQGNSGEALKCTKFKGSERCQLMLHVHTSLVLALLTFMAVGWTIMWLCVWLVMPAW
jgi:hypothetical protein